AASLPTNASSAFTKAAICACCLNGGTRSSASNAASAIARQYVARPSAVFARASSFRIFRSGGGLLPDRGRDEACRPGIDLAASGRETDSVPAVRGCSFTCVSCAQLGAGGVGIGPPPGRAAEVHQGSPVRSGRTGAVPTTEGFHDLRAVVLGRARRNAVEWS